MGEEPALDVPPTLARTPRSTNAVEPMIGICPEHAKSVKRWRDGQMALRWCAAGMLEVAKQSAASTATCTYQPYEPYSNATSPSRLSAPTAVMRT